MIDDADKEEKKREHVVEKILQNIFHVLQNLF